MHKKVKEVLNLIKVQLQLMSIVLTQMYLLKIKIIIKLINCNIKSQEHVEKNLRMSQTLGRIIIFLFYIKYFNFNKSRILQ